MKKFVIDFLMKYIKDNNRDLDDVKCEEIRYGLLGTYTLITKTSVIILLTIIIGFFDKFIVFFIFYSLLRGIGYGTHAKSNISCWIYSTVLIIGIPYLLYMLPLTKIDMIVIWLICFINYMIFCPADTEKRPMINKKRKLKFKISILLLSLVYLFIIIYFNGVSKAITSALVLEALLTNPLGYILMGQKVRFKLNDIHLFKRFSKGGI